jgi:hypothetical protein
LLSVTADVRAKGSPTDVPDNRPLSDGSGRVVALGIEHLSYGLWELLVGERRCRPQLR